MLRNGGRFAPEWMAGMRPESVAGMDRKTHLPGKSTLSCLPTQEISALKMPLLPGHALERNLRDKYHAIPAGTPKTTMCTPSSVARG